MIVKEVETNYSLKKCPFCGGRAITNIRIDNRSLTQSAYVACMVCGSEGRPFTTKRYVDEETVNDSLRIAVDYWNQRYVAPEDIQKYIQACKADEENSNKITEYGYNTPKDFPNFVDLYNQYMFREIGKKEFADILGVDKETLEHLISTFTEKRRK